MKPLDKLNGSKFNTPFFSMYEICYRNKSEDEKKGLKTVICFHCTVFSYCPLESGPGNEPDPPGGDKPTRLE